MFTYVLMGVPFILFVIIMDVWLLKTRVIATKQCWIVMAVLMTLTAVFDQLLTGLPMSAAGALSGAWGAPYLKHVHGLDDIALTLQHEDKIAAYEAAR